MAEKKEHPIIRRYVAELLTGRGHAFTRIMLIFIAIQLIRILVMLPFALPNLIRDGTEYIQWKYKQCQVYSQMVDEFKKKITTQICLTLIDGIPIVLIIF